MTTVDHRTGEIVNAPLLSASEARALTDRIRQTLSISHDLISAAYAGRAWVALGYETWDAYCGGEFTEARMVRLEREQRREIVAAMRAEGMSTRAIASGIGVDRETVTQDLRQVAGNQPPAEPKPVVGQDGKTYQPPAPKPIVQPEPQQRPSAPARRPLTDSFFDAAFDLNKALDRVVRLTQDNRFTRNAQQVAAKHRSDLLKQYEALAGVLALLPESEA